MIENTGYEKIIQCDMCNYITEESGSEKEVIRNLEHQGWRFINREGEWVSFCRDCPKEATYEYFGC